jgi:hypothetical protein
MKVVEGEKRPAGKERGKRMKFETRKSKLKYEVKGSRELHREHPISDWV